MLHFDELLAKMNTPVSDGYGENIVQNGDFSEHRLSDNKKWGTMQDTGDGSWVAESGRIEVQKSTGHGGTPAKKVKSTVLELDSLTGRKGLGATNSNSVVTQEIEEIDGPGTYRISLDYKGATKRGLSVEETGTAEVWVGDKLVAVLSQEKRGWEERIVEFTLDEDDIPADGVELKLVSTGRADGKGAQVDNISLREIGDTGLLGEELVTNGSFEDHPPMRNKGAFEAIPGWSVSDDSVIELKSVRKPITPRDKSDTYIELDSHGENSNSTVVQNIEVPEDGTYLLSFDYSPRAGRGKNPESTSPIKVMVGDEVVAEISAAEVGWKPFTFNVDLAKGPVKLSFEGTGIEDKVGGLLDNVALRKVAELGEGATPINEPEEEAAEATATTSEVYESGLLGEVFFADEHLTKLDQALTHVDDTPDATFIATEIDYGNKTGWFHTDLDFVLEHDGDSLVEHTEGALDKNVNHTAMQLTGEIYLEAGVHKFYNRTDDGFRLTIDGQELAEYEGLRAARTTTGEIEVAEDGWYDIQIDYFDWKGHSKLRIEHDGPGGARDVLDEGRLRHKVEVDNLGPDATDDAADGVENTAITIDALSNDTDPDGDTVFILDATDGANGTVTFTPPNVEEVANTEPFKLGENLIVNGDFEDNPLNGRIGWGHWDSIEGWDSPVGRVEVQTNNYGTGNTRGNAVVELDSHGKDSNSTLQQDVQIEEAGTYQFSLDYAMRGKHAWTNGVGVRINGETVHEVIKPNEKGFQTITLDVELDPGTAVIEIYALGKQDSIGTVIDNISLRQVQENDPVRVFTAPDGGVITYTPEPGFTGTDEFTYTISDGNGGTDTATVTVVVNSGNHAPVAVDDQIETPEDTAITVDLLSNDQDPDGDAISIVELGEVENGTLELNADGTVTFTPAADFHGEVTFEYTISDGELTSTATATIVVTPVNDPVIAYDDQATTLEDRSVSIDVLANDVDVDGDVLTITELGPVENGTLRLNVDGTIRFTPDDDFFGTVTFEYTVSDGETSSTATATVEVTPVEDPARAEDDAFEVDEDTSLVMDLLANDIDIDGDTLTIVDLGPVENGTLSLDADGRVTFTPEANFFGTVSFEYWVSDGTDTASATATIEVTEVNDAVEAHADSYETDEDTPIVLDLLANDVDGDGDALTITSIGTVTNGSAQINADGTVTFTPSANFNGTVSFTYTVSDGRSTSTATATVEVAPVNDGPLGVADSASTEGIAPVTIDVLANDTDVDGDDLSIVDIGTSADGAVMLNADGTITFIANDDFVGTANFTYMVSDGSETDTVDVTVEVISANRAPTPENDIVTMDEDTSITIDLLANDTDPDGDALTITSLGSSANGTLIDNGDGTVTFTPAADYVGNVVISYSVADDDGLSASAQLRITVANVNDGPVAVDDVAEVSREETVEVNVLGNDYDIDAGDTPELVSATSTRGSVSIVDGMLVFDPLTDFDYMEVETTTEEVITYTIRDEGGAETTGTLTLTVTAPRQAVVNETLSFVDNGASGTNANLDAGDGEALISDVGLDGNDNNDTLKITVDTRGGNGRTSSRGDNGSNSTTGDGEDGTDALVAGGLGGNATSELVDAYLNGDVYEDRLDVTVEADGGRGGKGGAGGAGGDANPLGVHTVQNFGGGAKPSTTTAPTRPIPAATVAMRATARMAAKPWRCCSAVNSTEVTMTTRSRSRSRPPVETAAMVAQAASLAMAATMFRSEAITST